MIGIGLADEKDITLRGMELVKRSTKVYLETYTSLLQCSKEDLEQLYGKEVMLADRDMVEKKADKMLDEAASSDVAFLVIGDPMSATTHLDLMTRAAKRGIAVEVVHNASIMTAVGIVGLELYKYGKTTSIVFPQEGWEVQSHYDVIKENLARGLHTLCLLDIKVKEPSKEDIRKGTDSAFQASRFMTVNQAIESLFSIEKNRGEGVFTDETLCVGCARLGAKDMKIMSGTAKELITADFGGPLHSLIVPGKLHFMEEDALKRWK
ncbi:MAG: diphthine synthase [Candidatus Woesearchaeota archaeon]